MHSKPHLTNEGEQVTLDMKHHFLIQKIIDEEKTIQSMKKTMGGLKRQLRDPNIALGTSLDTHEKIRKLKNLVRNIRKKRVSYHLENADVVFDYFEQKQQISTAKASNTVTLNEFFNIKSDEKAAAVNDDKLNRYLMNINEVDTVNFTLGNTEQCTFCGGEMVIYESDGILVCTNCSKITRYIIEHEKPSYKEPPKEACFYAYKRINHFREILAQFQAKESTQIPEQVLEDFKMQIKKERIDLSKLTNKKSKEILKKLHHSKYYEHVPFIKDKIGIKPPIMNNALEDSLCNLFLEIQAPYAKFCPDYRVNFLNYYYTIYKLCELLERHEFLEYFPMLKDKTKRIEQDAIWKNICKELNWKFIPTI